MLKYKSKLAFFFKYPSFSSSQSHINFYQISETHVNMRLDTFIKQNFDMNYSLIHKLLRTKKIHILSPTNIKVSKYDYRLKLSDQLIYPKSVKLISEVQEFNLEIENTSYNETKAEYIKSMILYEDNNYLILNKTSNLSSQGGQDPNHNLLPLLKNYYHFKSSISIIHRLDKNTTGVLFLGKHKLAAKILSKFFYEKENIEKYYIALVSGLLPKGKKGLIKLPLVFHNAKMKVCNLTNEDREECQTYFEVLEGFVVDYEKDEIRKAVENEKNEEKGVSLVKVKIIGGKKHQIRAHLSQVLKTPIVFDRKYGFDDLKLEKFLIKISQNFRNDQDEINCNMVKINGIDTVLNINSNLNENNEKIDQIERENLEDREYFALHAFQIFIRTKENVQSFDDFLKVSREMEDFKGEIAIRAKLPLFLANIAKYCFKLGYPEFLKVIEKKRF